MGLLGAVGGLLVIARLLGAAGGVVVARGGAALGGGARAAGAAPAPLAALPLVVRVAVVVLLPPCSPRPEPADNAGISEDSPPDNKRGPQLDCSDVQACGRAPFCNSPPQETQLHRFGGYQLML